VLGGLAALAGSARGARLQWVLGVVEAEITGGQRSRSGSSPGSPGDRGLRGRAHLVGALIAGVVPALKVTRGLSARLRGPPRRRRAALRRGVDRGDRRAGRGDRAFPV
jgi:hypothetical protein